MRLGGRGYAGGDPLAAFGQNARFSRRALLVDNQYLTAVGQMPGIFSADECLWLASVPLPATQADIYDGNTNDARVDHELRRTHERLLPNNREFGWVFQRLRKLAVEANERAWQFRLDERMSAHILEYVPDGFFDWHMDLGRGPTASRKLTTVTFLTPPEDYEGGDLLFMDGSAPLRPAQGATAIFPSYMLHKVTPVTRGNRHTLVSWLHGPCFS